MDIGNGETWFSAIPQEASAIIRKVKKMTYREQLCLKSYLHNPIQLSQSDRKAILEQLNWQLKHYKNK